MKYLIKREIAELAKDKGFKPKTMTTINTFEASLDIKPGIKLNYQCKLLLLEEIKMWLRLEYNIEIEVYRTAETTTGENYGCQGEDWNNDPTEDMFNFYDKTYEGALEMGILQTLKMV